MAIEGDQLASPTLAELYYKQGNLGMAIRVLNEVLALRPENLEIRARVHEMEREFFKAMDAGDRDETIRKLSKILEAVRKERRG
jgi:hypothetical protein